MNELMKKIFTKISKRRGLRTFLLFTLYSLAFNIKSAPLEDDFFDMSLEQLSDIEITSVAKKSQKLSMAASSIFVLTQEDIKRSGVTTIPDALRMAPGVQVAKLDANKWAISIRGFNDIFSNKLLVLIDGRSVYSPFFGGAYWDTVDTILEDVERIEIVRGPGGTLWGANAVNGVINIITKNAKDSEGLFISAIAGNEETGQLSVRYGGEISDDTYYRVYAKGFEKDDTKEGQDDWRMGRVGFRVDSTPTEQDQLTIQAEVYAGEEREVAMPDREIAPFKTFASKTDVFGGHAMLRWHRDLGNGSDISFQSYYDRTERDHFYIIDRRDTVDFDIQHRFPTFWNQEFMWGLGFRYIDDEVRAGSLIKLSPEKRSDRIYSGFIQDEISLIDEKLILTIGSKFEHNSYTGFEFQPSARILWKPFDKHSVWGAVSRSVRVPSRIEQDGVIRSGIAGPGLAVNIIGNHDMDSEELIAYEGGYRFLDNQFSFDLSFFYNEYDKLRSVEVQSADLASFSVPLILANELHGETYGFEIAANWNVTDDWKLSVGYSYIQMQLHISKSSLDITEEQDEGDTPHNQLNIRSLWQVSENLQLDGAIRYVDLVRESEGLAVKEAISSYVTMDLRAAWRIHKSLTLSAIGQNLFGRHREFRSSTIQTQATDVEPSWFFQADVRF